MLVVWIILHWGWRYSFVFSGLAALVFAFVWQRYYHDPDKDPKVSREELDYIWQGQVQVENGNVAKAKEVPMYKLLTYRRIFAMCSGFFLYMYFATVFHVWIPAYLVHAKGFSLKAMGIAVTFPFLAGITVELTGARLLDTWLKRGGSLTTVRRTGQLFSYFGTAICVFLAIAAATPTMTVVWLTAAYGIKAICGAQNWAIASEVAPQGQVGPVAALNGMSGALAVIVAPLASGFLIQTRWGYNGALYVMAVALLMAGILYGLLDYKPVTLKSALASTNQ